MKTAIFSIIILFAFSKSYSQRNDTSERLIYDTNKIAIITFDYKQFYGDLDSTNKPHTLSQNDIEVIENIFLQSISEHDSGLKNDDVKDFFFIDLNQWYYRRQYVCYENKEGEKIVYVDCFCATDINWKKNMVIVDDGGKCFFNLKINLTTKKYFDFFVNGYAVR